MASLGGASSPEYTLFCKPLRPAKTCLERDSAAEEQSRTCFRKLFKVMKVEGLGFWVLVQCHAFGCSQGSQYPSI